MVAQIKKDGVYAVVVCTQEYGEFTATIFGRTGKKLSSVGPLEREMSEWATDELFTGVLIAELCCEDSTCSLEMLSGIVNPNRKEALDLQQLNYANHFQLYFHDILSLAEFKKGESCYNYAERYQQLIGLDLWDYGIVLKSYTLDTYAKCEGFAEGCISQGEEGAVFKMPGQRWVAGRKNEVATKIVRGVDFDLKVVDVAEGKGKRKNMVANLIVEWRMFGKEDGKKMLLPTDGRFTDSQRIHWWNNPEEIIGKVVHVHALQIGSKGALRLPKVRAVRIDKTEPDL